MPPPTVDVPTADTLAGRTVALGLMNTVLGQGQPLDGAVEGDARMARLSARDRAFARNLVSTTLRRLGQIDHALGRCMEKPLAPGPARDILRLGAGQLLFLATPAHAAVDTSVRLAHTHGLRPLTGLINAVLRRLDREGRAIIAAQDAPRLNTPGWLWESWRAAYGSDTCRRIAEAHGAEPPLDLTVKGDASVWAERLGGALSPTGTVRLAGRGTVADLASFDDGAWWVQDAAAALPARLLGDVAGRTVIDLCAAPGGKTAQLAAAGARVTAVDRAPKRLARLEDNLARLGLTAETVSADVLRWRPETPADAVLLDAPCTATGTIRRHPDVAWLKEEGDVAKLADVQDRLLAAAAQMVRPGGLLVYCSCSLQPEEGPERVAALLASGAEVARAPLEPGEAHLDAEAVSPDGDLRTLPCHMAEAGGMDGFFAARLRRL